MTFLRNWRKFMNRIIELRECVLGLAPQEYRVLTSGYLVHNEFYTEIQLIRISISRNANSKNLAGGYCIITRGVCSNSVISINIPGPLQIVSPNGVTFKLKKNVKQVPYLDPPFDTDKLLHSAIKRNFVIELSNRFESLSVAENPDQEELWEAVKNSFHTAVIEILGYKKRPKDQWLSDQTWNLVKERKLVEQTHLQSQTSGRLVLKNVRYREADKAVKKSFRNDLRTLIDKKAKEEILEPYLRSQMTSLERSVPSTAQFGTHLAYS
ncbi:hypothetical protein QYM36_013386 [Artemia franciscana]|uniref:Uncharacterized protein n=1 Tax=Artemia franciscana TaxID=6661 RepID=A0AA88HQ23_ARTSF|nr:hypothetical protein QYM36_013386 [Artemia franciscana]